MIDWPRLKICGSVLLWCEVRQSAGLGRGREGEVRKCGLFLVHVKFHSRWLTHFAQRSAAAVASLIHSLTELLCRAIGIECNPNGLSLHAAFVSTLRTLHTRPNDCNQPYIFSVPRGGGEKQIDKAQGDFYLFNYEWRLLTKHICVNQCDLWKCKIRSSHPLFLHFTYTRAHTHTHTPKRKKPAFCPFISYSIALLTVFLSQKWDIGLYGLISRPQFRHPPARPLIRPGVHCQTFVASDSQGLYGLISRPQFWHPPGQW